MPDVPLTAEQGDRLIELIEALPGAIARAIASRPAAAGGTDEKAIRLEDRQALQALLPVICTQWQPRTVFFAAEALEHVAAMPDVVATLFHGAPINRNSTRRVGMLFARCEGVEIDGFVIRRGAEDSNGVLWVVDRV